MAAYSAGTIQPVLPWHNSIMLSLLAAQHVCNVCCFVCAGRDVVSLVENLRKSLPPNLGVLQRIMALEQVAAELTDRCGHNTGCCASDAAFGHLLADEPGCCRCSLKSHWQLLACVHMAAKALSLPISHRYAVCCPVLCCVVLCCRLYEEVEPARILDERAAATGSGKEYLVQYKVRHACFCCALRVSTSPVGPGPSPVGPEFPNIWQHPCPSSHNGL